MNISILKNLLGLLLLTALAACGGGGGGSGDEGGGITPKDNIISGVASKGLIRNGTVMVYALTAAGSKGNLLAQTSTDQQGQYTANVGPYFGPLLIEASGNYLDEASGEIRTILPTEPLRAALPAVSGTVKVAVTPLTELAVQEAANLTPTAIIGANNSVSNLFNIDIIDTLPVEPSVSGMQNASTSQKNYTLVLATISQLAQTSGTDIGTTIAEISAEMTAGRISAETVTDFNAALNTFINDSPHNLTGITTPPPELQTIGHTEALLHLVLSGESSTAIGAVDLILTFPEGITVETTGTQGELAPGVLTLAVPFGGEKMVLARYLSPELAQPAQVHIVLISTTPFSVGQLGNIQITVPGLLSDMSGFTTVELTVKDLDGVVLPGFVVTTSI